MFLGRKVFMISNQIFFLLVFTKVVFGDHVDDVLPFMVKIESKGGLNCAGTILTARLILTSAHCVDNINPQKLTVVHYSVNINRYKVAQIMIYPYYNNATMKNDIALLKTEEDFSYPWSTVTISTIPKSKVFPKCNLFQIIGWSERNVAKVNEKKAKSESQKPILTTIKIFSQENCTNLARKFGGVYEGEDKLCGVVDEDAVEDETKCFTGPGGPLICSLVQPKSVIKKVKVVEVTPPVVYTDNSNLTDHIDLLDGLEKEESSEKTILKRSPESHIQVGVVSVGQSCSKFPSFYARTDLYQAWIMRHVREAEDENNFHRFRNFTFLTPLINASERSYLQLRFIVIFSVLNILLSPFLLFFLY